MARKKKSRSSNGGGANEETDGISDGLDHSRFDVSKPQFRKPKETSSKVKIDKRFASVMTDSRFQLNVKDKYGRKKKKDSVKDELSEFYTVEDENDDDELVDGEAKLPANADKNEPLADSKNPAEDESPESRIAYLTALSRGEIDVSSSSDEEGSGDDSQSSDDESSDGSEDSVMGKAGVLDPSSKKEDVELTTEKSPYIAVMNMDWINVRAVDIFSILSSFSPPGALKKVQVFPSDFGMERMVQEEKYGPDGLWKRPKNESFETNDELSQDALDPDVQSPASGVQDNTEGTEFDPEKLRAYEASRLRYYFAVVEFSSSEAADVAYREVDGLEFEYSSTTMDLRSIPQDSLPEVIDGRTVRDECTGLPSNYNPPDFVVSALQKTTVDCSWEVGDRDRERNLTAYRSGQTWNQLAEGDDLKAYLASDNSSDDDDEDARKASRLRQMFGLDSDGDQTGEGSTSASSVDDDDDANCKAVKFVPRADAEIAVPQPQHKRTDDSKNELTPWEKYKAKRKEKRSERRRLGREKRKEIRDIRSGAVSRGNKPLEDQSTGQLELLFAGDRGDEEDGDFDMRGIQRIEKNKEKKLRGSRKRKEDRKAADVAGTEFEVNVADDRFRDVLDGSNHMFAIDRTDPNYKETPAMQKILKEQTRRRNSKKRKKSNAESASLQPDVTAESANAPSTGASALSALVASLKSKAGQ